MQGQGVLCCTRRVCKHSKMLAAAELQAQVESHGEEARDQELLASNRKGFCGGN